LFQFFY